jgi:hypothetical protein
MSIRTLRAGRQPARPLQLVGKLGPALVLDRKVFAAGELLQAVDELLPVDQECLSRLTYRIFSCPCGWRVIVNDKGRCHSQPASANRHRDLCLYRRPLGHWPQTAFWEITPW